MPGSCKRKWLVNLCCVFHVVFWAGMNAMAVLLSLAAAGINGVLYRVENGLAQVFPRLLAQGFALAGLPERALHWLEIAVGRGFVNHPFLTRHDPCFRDLRGEPRFVKLMEVVRSRWERFES